ncbi:MAG: YbbR-like domain-containing protein [Desulfatitalea sp.]|nr:YbbR-like domain-containing protein [Desulfatitalea sp.]
MILESAAVTPGTVEVMGAQRVLDRIETIYTEKVPLENLKTSGQMNVALVLQPRALKITEGSRDKVEVSFAIGRRPN